MPSRHGITLLELLIALTVLMTITGISVVVLNPRFNEQRFTSAGDAVMQHCLLARAEAQLTGRPVEIIYLPESNRLVARYFDPERSAEALFEDDEPIVFDAESDFASMDDEEVGTRIFDGWAEQFLPDVVRVQIDPPEALVGADDVDDAWADFDARQDAFEEVWADDAAVEIDPFRLVVFLPDGTALLVRTVWLIDEVGLLAECSINRFTGLPAIQRIELLTEDDLAESEDDRAEDDESDEQSLADEIEELMEEAGAMEADQPQMPPADDGLDGGDDAGEDDS